MTFARNLRALHWTEADMKLGKRFVVCTQRQSGFSILELLVVLAIIAALAAIAAPVVGSAIQKAKETALQQNLVVMRKALDSYYADNGIFPPDLETLVSDGYIRAIPPDSVNGNGREWSVSYDDQNGVNNVHSKSENEGSNGIPFTEW